MQSQSSGTVPPDAIEKASDVLSKKWTVAILYSLFADGPQGFSALEEKLATVSGKVLSECLESLQESGVVERRVLQEKPLRVEYVLTEKGRDLEPVIEGLATWSETHLVDETPTVLLADDDARLVELHSNWLEQSYDIVTATDGKTAREQTASDVDVIVSDRRMPGLSGGQLAQYVDTSSFQCGIVLLSSVSVDETLLGTPFDVYLRKPTTPEELESAIETALARAKQPPDVREFESLQTRLSLFNATLSTDIRNGNPGYERLLDRAEVLAETLDRTETLAEMLDRAGELSGESVDAATGTTTRDS